MVRRSLVIALFVLAALACAAPAALAYEPVVGSTLFPHARLVAGADPAMVVWPATGDTSLVAVQYSGAPLTPSRTLVSGIGALGAWYATGHGTQVTVVWKDGASIYAKCVDVSTDAVVFGPVTVCTDAAVVALDGAATAAVPGGAAPDGSGGSYIWCTATPTRGVAGYGDSLLTHVSAAGVLAAADPGLAVAKGTISALAPDDEGHAFALLGPPGRAGMGAQRFSRSVAPDAGWAKPISPYSPLLPAPAATPTAVAIAAGDGATIAWREGTKVKVQRYPAGGGVLWMDPPAATMSGHVEFASDGNGGAFLAGPSGAGITACHVVSSGAVSTHTLTSLGLIDSWVGALVTNRAGDLFIGYGDHAASGAAGVGLLTWTGGLSTIGADTMRPDTYDSGVADGAGGAYLAGDTTGTGYLWHLGSGPGLVVTFRPRSLQVPYGKSVSIGGYVTSDGAAVDGAHVTFLAPDSSGGAPAPVQTGSDGYYHVVFSPTASATWSAVDGAAVSNAVRIEVQPKVTLSLSHLRSSTRLTEIFSGSVAPKHAGSKVLVQKAVGTKWSTVASGRLDSSSRYRILWAVPYKTATYKLRTMLPAHADHAQGTSTSARLRVVVRKS